MATYLQIFDLRGDSNLRNKLAVACIVAADTVRTELASTPNHTARVAWAKSALADPERAAIQMLWAVLAQNVGLTVAQIQSASDAQIQTAVNNAVDLVS